MKNRRLLLSAETLLFVSLWGHAFGAQAETPPAAELPPSLEQAIARELESLRLSRPAKTIELSCRQAIAAALENNFDIKIARATTAEDAALRDEAWGRFDPYFLASADARKYRYPTVRLLDVGGLTPVGEVKVNPGVLRRASAQLAGTLHLGTTYSLSVQGQREDTPRSAWFGFDPRHTVLVNATITQPLLRGGWLGYNMTDIRQAQNNLAVARATFEEKVADVVASVEKAYWNLVYARERLRVQEAAYREARTFLAVMQARNAVGYQASELDVVGAKAQVETRKYELVQAHADLLAARDRLLLLLNPPGERGFRESHGPGRRTFKIEEVFVEPTSAPSVEPLTVDIDKAIACAFRNRPVYLTYELQIQNQQLEIERRYNELLPRLDLTAEWNQHGLQKTFENSWSQFGTGRYYTWFLGAQLEIPIFNTAARARLRRAQAALQRLTLKKKQFENQLIFDVVKAARDLRAAAWQVKTTKAAVKYARKQLEGEKRRLAGGTSTTYTVLQMQNDVLKAELNALQAVVAYRNALVDLERAKGTLLKRYGIEAR